MIKAEIIFWIIVAAAVIIGSALLILACCKVAGDCSREEGQRDGK